MGTDECSWLYRVCPASWESETAHWDEQTDVVVQDSRERTNYSGIILLSIPDKVYSRVLEKRVRAVVGEAIQEEQCCLRDRRSAKDQLFNFHINP